MTTKEDNGALGLDGELKRGVLSWSREVLAASLNGKPAPAPPAGLEGLRGGVFVTLKIGGDLRGCVGRFEFSSPLADAIEEMVKAAAFQDPRFPPLSKRELEGLEITVSVLTEPRPLESIDDLVIGRDGLYLLHPGGRGVLLPVVAEEQGWTPLEFAANTARKAGLHPQAWKDPEASLMVFTASPFSSES